MTKKLKQRLWMIGLMAIMGVISASLLAGIYQYAQPIVERNRRIKLYSAVLTVLRVDYSMPDMEVVFQDRIKIIEQEGLTLYEGYSDKGRLLGYALPLKGGGFWGPIATVLGLEPDWETLKGIEIIENVETPGLGARITEPAFKASFRGLKATPNIGYVVHKEPERPNEFQAITGATETSKSITRIFNKGIRQYRQVFEISIAQ